MSSKQQSKLSLILVLLLLQLQACGPNKEDYDQLVTISTVKGELKLILFNDTPKHKASFIELAQKGAYDSTSFHRVIKDFVVQGGDLAPKEDFEKESRRLIPAEFVPRLFHVRGMLGAARQNTSQNPTKHSTTQFYIVDGEVYEEKEIRTDIDKLNGSLSKYLYDGNHEDLINEFKELQDEDETDELQKRVLALREEMEEALDMDFENTKISQEQIQAYTTIGGVPHLDGEYTIFGKVVDGLEVIDAIADTEVDSLNKPIVPIYMTIKVEDVLKTTLSEQYGIIYTSSKTDK